MIVINWDTCLNYLFEEQVSQNLNHKAVSIDNQTLTYKELNEKANQCAHYLRSIGVGRDSIVALLMERSVELMIAMLGILKAGGAYLPIDPAYPQQRIDFILEDADVSAVLTSHKFKDKLMECDVTVLSMDTDMLFIEEQSIENLEHINESHDLAYIIYTSGSTGVPKGCMIEHRAICNRLLWMQQEYQLTPLDNVLQKTPYTFDVSVWEFFWPMITGAQVIFAKPEGHKDANYLVELINERKITVCHFVPSMLKFFVAHKRVSTCTSLRYVFTSGEALSYELMLRFKQNLGAKLHNLYGPTEAAVDVTYWACEERSDGIVPIGKAIDNIHIYLLDESLKEVAKGQEADLYIGGIGLARGYLKRKELTDKVFMINPYTGERIYKTGDRGRLLEDGNIEYIGRADSQVKLRGNRIELGEIENTLKQHQAIEDAVVCIKDEKSEDPKLVAYVIVHQNMPASKDLRVFLKDKLPQYMIPNYFTQIEALPVTAHGKLDTKALPWPIQATQEVIQRQQEVLQKSDLDRKGVEAFIKQIIERLLRTEQIAKDADLFDLGATSLTMVQIVEEIDTKYNVSIPIDLFLEESTIEALTNYIMAYSLQEVNEQQTLEPIKTKVLNHNPVVVDASFLDFVRETIHAPNLKESDDLFDYGATSFTLVQIAEFIEAKYGVSIPIDEMLDHTTVEGLAIYIEQHTQDRSNISLDLNETTEKGVVTFNEISALLALLKKADINGEEKYLYPSAGGLYSIQTYVYIKAHQVEGLKEGYYYYHPMEHRLYFIAQGHKEPESIFNAGDTAIYHQGSFVIFFVAKLDAIEPVYFQTTPRLTVLDTGYMAQLLMSHEQELQVDLHPALGIDFEAIQEKLALSSQHRFIHCMIGGKLGTSHLSLGEFKDYPREHYTKFSDYLKIDETTILKKMKFMNKIEHDTFINQKLQLRKCSQTEEYVQLSARTFEEQQYLQRGSKRQYASHIVTKENLLKLLAMTQSLKLTPTNAIDIYVYIKANGVEGYQEGIYRYQAEDHTLQIVTQPLTTRIKLSHMPFNRFQYEKSSFSIYLVGNVDKLQATYKDESEYMVLLEAGYLGQKLMDYQVSCEIGLCPIGGVNFSKIEKDFKLREGQVLLHSFTGGTYSYKEEEESIGENDLAIIGMSGRFANCDTTEAYWEALSHGKTCFTPMSEERKQLYHITEDSDCQCGYLNAIDTFDCSLFHISPGEAKCIDPQERIFLEVVWECLEDAGYTAQTLNQSGDKVGVFVGSMWNEYQNYSSSSNKASSILATSLASSIANRVSYYFDFIGPSIAINTSCSSGMTAIHLACESLLRQECHVAIVGGVNVISHPYHIDTLQQLHLVSDTGCCKPFSADANGWIAGEGAGAIMIKSLKDAKADKDQILGVIKGTAIGHTGKTSRFGAPKSTTQVIGIQDVLSKAGVTKDSIAYIEAAAPGASLADSSEMEAIRKVFGDRKEEKDKLWMSSVKGNIGHLESASAISQVVKVLLAFKHAAIAPTVNMQVLNPLIQTNWKVGFVQDLKDMEFDAQHRVLINSFGATGSSGHLILESYKALKEQQNLGKEQLAIPLSAATNTQLVQYAHRIMHFLEKEEVNFDALVSTLRYGRVAMEERIVFLANTLDQFKNLLKDYLESPMQIDRQDEIITKASIENITCNALWQQAYTWTNHHNEAFTKCNGPYKKVSLPTYPFEQSHNWLTFVKEQAEENIDLKNSSVGNHKEVQSKKEQLVKWLIQLFAKISGFSSNQIQAKVSLEHYGISSAMIQMLNEKLSEEIGNVSKTIFFECDTIDEIADYLLAHHRAQLKGLIGGHDAIQEVKVQAIKQCHEPYEVTHDTEEIAIIGLDGIYPQADNLEMFWDNLVKGKDCITTIPEERWDYKLYFDSEKHVPGKTYCKWGGFINDVDKFDAAFFNISPREAIIMDPQERLFLQTAWHALEDAGYNQLALKQTVDAKVGVFVGVMYGEYQLISAASNQSIFASYSSIANRVSHVLNLNGPSMAVDTMCSSSLTALHLAVESIKRGECKMAIAGGVNLSLHPSKYIAHAQMTMSSTDGHCRSFGKDGTGFVPGEGVGVLVLKPLQEAIKDHDHIYGVIKGTALNHGGKTKGYTVPNPTAQSKVILDAWKHANISPEQLSYIEAHGTGTILGDPIEINGLTRSFRQYTKQNEICSIGSVKSNIGHLESAAGVAGITKILLQMKYKQLVPSLFAEEINPNIDIQNTPFYIQQSVEDWECKEGLPRTAAMSAFGAGGSNAHVVIQEYQEESLKQVDNCNKACVIVLSARDNERLIAYAQQLKEKIDKGIYDGIALEDFAYTLQVGREAMEYRLGTVVTSMSMLAQRLNTFIRNQDDAEIFVGAGQQQDALLEEMMSDSEFEGILHKWVRQNDVKKLLAAWVKGAHIDWSILYPDVKPSRVSIMGYPFLKKHYWVENKKVAINAYKEIWMSENHRNELSYDYKHILCWIENPEDRVKFEVSLQDKQHTQMTFLDTFNEQYIEDYLSEYPDVDAFLVECVGTKVYETSLPFMRIVLKHQDQLKKAVLFGYYENALQRCYMESLIGMERTFKAITRKEILTLIVGDRKTQPLSRVKQVIDELYSTANSVVRYEDNMRYVPILQPSELLDEPVKKLRTGGTYLLTGGLGGIGTVIADYLAKHYHANLILIGRKALNETIATQMNQWEQYGARAIYVQADLTSKERLQQALQEAKIRFGQINGVLHLAGVMGKNDLLHKSIDELTQELAPKVEGTILLDQLLANEPLDWMCYFSSSSAILGDFGTYDYATGNRFLMAYADERNQRVKAHKGFGETYVINWPIWEVGGMTKQSGDLQTYLDATGQHALTSEEGIALLLSVLSGQQYQILLSTKEEDIAKNHQKKAINQVNDPIQQGDWLNQKLKALVGKILQLSMDEIEGQTSFSDLGFDSISLSELSKAIKNELGITIAISLLWQYFTIERLQNYILSTYEEEVAACVSHVEKVLTHVPPVEPEKAKEIAQTIQDDVVVNEPIAIIGMSGRFPDADNIDQLWEKVKVGESVIKEIPAERCYGDMPYKWGGFIKDVDKFDPLFFNMSPKEAELLDPQQRLFLQEAWHALEDAGYMNEAISGTSCGVYVGVEESQYDKLSGNMGGLNSNRNATLSARIAYELDLKGPNMVINTACSSGLVALSQATQALRYGECDMAIVGGVNLNLAPDVYRGLSKNNLLSTDGQAHIFDQKACGMIPSEAVVSIVLKPLSKAQKDHDRIYGCIVGNGINYNGKSNGITAPNVDGQIQLMKDVLQKAQIQPSQIDYVMAHSVGSKFGDPIEIESLQAVMGKEHTCFMGSIKPLIGHTFAASGLVNLVVVLKAMQENIMIGVHQLDEVNDEINLEKSSVQILRGNKQWVASSPHKQLASILATGMSGTNAQVLVESYKQAPSNMQDISGAYLVCLSAKTQATLLESVRDLHTFLMCKEDIRLRDISYSLIKGRMPMKSRVCFVATSVDELKQQLDDYILGHAGDSEDIIAGEIGNQPASKESFIRLSAKESKDALRQYGKQWVNGLSIKLEEELVFNYLTLPTYPFRKRVCWYENDETKQALEQKKYENEAAKFYTYGTLDKEDEFSLEYLTFCPFEEKIPGFSMSRVFLAPKQYQTEYALIQEKQIEMREVLFSCVDFSKVNQLFDFGCGHGTDVMQFAQRYPHMSTCGYTITEAQAELGNERIKNKGLQDRVHIYHRDSVKHEFPSQYDAILGIEVACHIKDKQTLFSHVSSALDEKGSVLLMDFISNLQGRIEDKGIEVSIATKDDWIEVFSTNGLIVEKIIDVSQEIANFLYDPEYEANTKDMPEVVKKGIQNFANNSIALEKKWTSYCLFHIKKGMHLTLEERIAYNLEKFDHKIPYQIASLNMRKGEIHSDN